MAGDPSLPGRLRAQYVVLSDPEGNEFCPIPPIKSAGR